MFNFQILRQSKLSQARLGVIKTTHGEIETPAFVGVATNGAIKALGWRLLEYTKTNILIANTYHLFRRGIDSKIARAGGIHKFSNWKKIWMTDSGGYQIFSLGFGRDLGVGKKLKFFPNKEIKTVKRGNQPNSVKITNQGVFFKDPLDGKELFLGPRESMRIQKNIGADIIFCFDECTPPGASRAYVVKSLERTLRWAKICASVTIANQALYGIVQGSRFKELREKSARSLSKFNFAGYGIGGDLGCSMNDTIEIINWSTKCLGRNKPRHLLGIGRLEDIEPIIKSGIDTFDCTVPTHYARHGIAFTSGGKLNLRQSKFLDNLLPLDKTCRCAICQNYSTNYISHLVRAGEITGLSLLTEHNLYYFNNYVEKIRQRIKDGKI